MAAEDGPAQFNELRAWLSGKPEMRDLELYAKVVWITNGPIWTVWLPRR
jgi:hypothetical protein